LRRIEQEIGVRRETAGDYLRSAGIALRRPGGWGRHSPSKAAIDPITDSEDGSSKAAIEVITGFLARKPGCGPASSCAPYRELIALELERDRNAMGIWQDLVDRHGFAGGYQSVRRFMRNLRGAATPEARAIILRSKLLRSHHQGHESTATRPEDGEPRGPRRRNIF
jgi:hypothetical protein